MYSNIMLVPCLSSDIHSSERSTQEILRRIGLASNIFGRLANIWKRTGLSLQTEIRLCNALVISVLLYGSKTWTVLKADERRLEAFHMSGSASEDDPAERGCSRSRTTLGSTPTTPGGSHMTASLGGRYDPWQVKRSTD